MSEKKMTLRGLKEDLLSELEDNKEEIMDLEEDDRSDRIGEFADGCVPVFNYDLLEVAQDELWLAVDEPEILAFDGKSTAVAAIAGNIYQELVEAGQNWLNNQLNEEDGN